MKNFSVQVEHIDLPQAATPQQRRVSVRWQNRPLADLIQGPYRAYIYPLYSPAGVALTAASPVDHPHHNSVTIGADTVCALLPPLQPHLSERPEEATYNLYVNEVFQGRAPGRIWATGIEAHEIDAGHLRVVQTLEWQGPQEWGAEAGRRVLAREKRVIDMRPGTPCTSLDIHSSLRPEEWDLRLGPTRHAYFTVRVADALRPLAGGVLSDAAGRQGEAAINGQLADWVDISGPAPHGRRAGLAVLPHASTQGLRWIATDWGTITLNPFLDRQQSLAKGEGLELGMRLVAHDGDAATADIAGHWEAFRTA